MKVICAPDKFKGSLTAEQAALAMQKGILAVLPNAQVVVCPIADGGEGTVDAMLAATQGQAMTTAVRGPRGQTVYAKWGLLGQKPQAADQAMTAVVEMASASGMALLTRDQLDPTKTSTWGTGQLIEAAIEHGATKLLIGIGGSATNDGGCGAIQALGGQFFDEAGQLIQAPITGGMLKQIARIDLSLMRRKTGSLQVVVACDVNNPLTGARGAAQVYAPQKGATPQQVAMLDEGLAHLAEVWKKDLGQEVALTPGSGAAGGLGGGLMAMLGASLQGGVGLVLSAISFREKAQGAWLCLTGEGRLDGQSLSGKACLGVAQAAHEVGVKRVVALVGSAADDAHLTLKAGLDGYHVIGAGLSLEASIAQAAELVERFAAQEVLSIASEISP